MIRTVVAAGFMLLAGLSAAQAHDFWLEAADGRVFALYGHPGEAAAADRGRVIALSAWGPDGQPVSLRGELRQNQGRVSAPQTVKGARVVSGWYDGGFWVRNAQGYANTNKTMMADVQESLWSQKYAKVLLPGGDAKAYGRVVGQRLEIIPLADPFAMKTGARLPVRVLLDGKPAVGIAVSAGDAHDKDAVPNLTDAAGETKVALPAGAVVVETTHKVPGTHPALADQDNLSATLSFTR